MKVRIPKVEIRPAVLFYGIEGERKERLTALLDSENIPGREVLPEELGQKTGYLCGMPGFEAGDAPAGEAFPDEALIFCGLSERQLDRMLKLLRDNDLIIGLKAAVTPTNQHWPFGSLLTEIARERAEMSRRR